jgi:glycosyltransferase involved in cell wall biosynthesis
LVESNNKNNLKSILFITYEYPTYTPFGGIAFYYCEVAQILAAQNFDVTVLSAKIHTGGGSIIRDNLKQNLTEIYLPSKDIDDFSDAVTEWLKINTLKFDILEMPSYRNILFQDVINGNVRKLTKTVIIRYHGSPFVERYFNGGHSNRMIIILSEYSNFNFFARIIKFISKKNYKLMRNILTEREYGLKADIVTTTSAIMVEYLNFNRISVTEVFPNPCQFKLINFIQKDEGRYIISYINRVELIKGFNIFVEMVNDLVHNDKYTKTINFICCGSSDKWDGDQQFLKNPNITFINQASPSVVLDLMIKSKIVVIPSLFESFSNVALEAMMCSCIVLIGKNVGIKEFIVDGVNGFVFDTTAENGLKDCVKRVLALSEESKLTISLNAYKTATDISNDEKMLNMYKRLVEG